MKQASILFICLIVGLLNTNAQLRIAITGGPQLSSVPGNYSPGWDTISYQFSNRQGWRAGLLADIHFTPRSIFYLQSGMFYSNKGRNLSAKFDTSTGNLSHVNGVQYLNYFEFPLNMVLKLNLGRKAKIMLGGGPYAAYLFSGRERREFHNKNGSVQTFENTDLKISTSPVQYNNLDYGLNGLFGFEFGRLIISGHYSQGFKDFYKPSTIQGDYKHQTISVSLGYYITKGVAKKQKKKDPKPAKEPMSKDQDLDGVPDKLDACPDKIGTLAMSGCPDADGDSVADQNDQCPNIAGLVKYKGCPVPDTDKDGINDEEDSCPETAGVKKYNGCPMPDTDNDGVNDEEDKCPAIAGTSKYKGCPIPDSDNDGINDEEDKCPKKKGVSSNQGCPEIKKAIIKKVDMAARRIQFKYKSVLLLPASKKVLNEVVKLLKKNPELNLSIEGHTSADGNPDNHMRLSYARAYSVKIYLESKGVSPFQLKAEGFGATRPLAKGSSPSQLARNRRVEMKLNNFQQGL